MRSASNHGTLGEVVRQRRRQLGWSQEELAARISSDGDDVRQSDISRLELGKVGLPRRARLQRIAAALGMSAGELLARSGWALGSVESSAPSSAAGPNLAAPAAARANVRLSVAMWPTAESAPSAPSAAETIVRLHDAIAEARLTMARSAAALDRARAIYDRTARPLPPRAGPGAAAERGGAE
jgi:transcriptional regulator with XRE-family HTH domain